MSVRVVKADKRSEMSQGPELTSGIRVVAKVRKAELGLKSKAKHRNALLGVRHKGCG